MNPNCVEFWSIFMSLFAFSSVPMSRHNIPPNPYSEFTRLFISWCCGWSGRPGYMTFNPAFFILSANSAALLQCSFILKPKWGILSESSNATFAFMVGPRSIKLPCRRSIIEFTSFEGPHTAPTYPVQSNPIQSSTLYCY